MFQNDPSLTKPGIRSGVGDDVFCGWESVCSSGGGAQYYLFRVVASLIELDAPIVHHRRVEQNRLIR